MEQEWFSEYRYRSLFTGITHDQYLDEPLEVIQMMVRIHDLVEQQRERQSKE